MYPVASDVNIVSRTSKGSNVQLVSTNTAAEGNSRACEGQTALGDWLDFVMRLASLRLFTT